MTTELPETPEQATVEIFDDDHSMIAVHRWLAMLLLICVALASALTGFFIGAAR